MKYDSTEFSHIDETVRGKAIVRREFHPDRNGISIRLYVRVLAMFKQGKRLLERVILIHLRDAARLMEVVSGVVIRSVLVTILVGNQKRRRRANCGPLVGVVNV